MEKICGTPFWNSSISWNVEKPHFTQCFQNLVLVLGSCGVLWIVAPVDFVKISRARGSPNPWTRRSVFKIVLKVILLLICILELATEVYLYKTRPNDGLDGLISAVSYLLTIVLTVIITLMCKKRGLSSSLALPSFWMTSTLSTLLSIYNDIQDFDVDNWPTIVKLVNHSVEFLISIIQLVLSNIADTKAPSHGRDFQRFCPLEDASLPSRLTFSWILSLLTKSVHNSLHQDYLVPLCPELSCSTVSKSFQKACTKNPRQQLTSFDSTENLVDDTTNTPSQDESTNYSYPRGKSLFRILLRTSRKLLVIASFLEIVYTLLYFLPAYILSLLLDSESGREEWHNYLYASALFITLIFASCADSQRKYYGVMAGLQVKTAVMNAVFEKALKVREKPETVKKLLASESDNIFQMVCITSEVWGAPLRLLIGIYIFWSFLGSSCFVGIASAMILIPLNVIVDQCAYSFQVKAVDQKNEGINLLSECINGMKVLKFYAWEEFFLEKIMSIRKSEISGVRKAEFLRMTFKFIFLSGKSLVMLVTFGAYVLMGNSTDAKTIFVSFLLIFLLKSPFRSILHILANFIQGLKSLSETQSFLESKEIISIPSDGISTGSSVQLTNASFTWEGMDNPCLKNLNLNIPNGSLIAIVGETKSGKSSLLRALLGELEKVDGTASVKGELAFVGNESWIQNLTLEKNILFLRPKDEKFYRKTLEACYLYTDIDCLPAGEETEIGRMGVHLSSSQKIKVELARAVYQKSDIYLLDDPLRFLDPPVAEHLYHRVIGRSGLLKEKTRILTTSSEEYLPLVDFILFLKEGKIVEQGTYSQLKDKDGHFSEFLKLSQTTTMTTTKYSPSSEKKQDTVKTYKFGKQGDLWYSTMVAPAHLENEKHITSESMLSTKGFVNKLLDLLKTVGFVLSILSILLAGLACSCEVASGVWLSNWTDYHGRGHNRSDNLLIYMGFILTQVCLTIACGILIFSISTNAAAKLYTWLLVRILRACQTTFEITPIKKIIQSFDVDFQYADIKIPETFYVWLMATLKAPALLVIIYVLSPYVSVLSIPLIFAFLVIQRLFLSAWQQLKYLTTATSCPLSNLLEDVLQGASNIRASRTSFHFFNRFHLKLDTHNNCALLFILVSRWLSCSIDIITAFLVLLTTVMAFYDKDKGDGFIGLAIICSLEMAETLTTIVYMTSMLNNDLTALERIKTLSELKQESEREDPANTPETTWPDTGEILIKHLTTTQSEAMYPALHNINLSINPGEKVAIIGKEESGTSTLLYSLFRLIEPFEGQIVIDNIDISKLGLRDLRSRLAFVPEETLVLTGTVRQNLDPNSAYTDDELWSALESANLRTSLLTLDSAVRENLSTEEKYLLSIARCILKRPKIVIIDETEIPDSRGRQLFTDSTVLSFSNNPLPDFEGRVIRLLSGEVINEEFPA